MYYLYCETEKALYIAKAKHYESLLSIINRCKLKEWTISDVPINYEENQIPLIDWKFLETDTRNIIDYFETLTKGPIQ